MNNLYAIRYAEANCPDYDQMEHQILIEAEIGKKNHDSFHVMDFLKEVEEIKAKMDCPEDYDDGEEYEEWTDEGWHDKIEAAADIVLKNHPEYKATRIEGNRLLTVEAEIN